MYEHQNKINENVNSIKESLLKLSTEEERIEFLESLEDSLEELQFDKDVFPSVFDDE